MLHGSRYSFNGRLIANLDLWHRKWCHNLFSRPPELWCAYVRGHFLFFNELIRMFLLPWLLLGFTYWYDKVEEAYYESKIEFLIIWFVANLNHSSNFTLYVISGRKFREQFLLMIRCRQVKPVPDRRNISRTTTQTNVNN